MISIVEEMWQTVCRTAYSLIISESQDFANEILDPQGNPLAHSPRAMPLFNLTLTRCVQALLEHFPPETLQEGDVLVTNDPWLCAGHLFDIALVSPVFSNGRLVALERELDPLVAREALGRARHQDGAVEKGHEARPDPHDPPPRRSAAASRPCATSPMRRPRFMAERRSSA